MSETVDDYGPANSDHDQGAYASASVLAVARLSLPIFTGSMLLPVLTFLWGVEKEAPNPKRNKEQTCRE